MKYLPRYSDPKKQPAKEQDEQDEEGKMLKPSICSDSARKFYKDYNIKLDHCKCNICITCQLLQNILHDLPRDDPCWFDFEQQLLWHQVKALANPRMPLMNISVAFYKHILGTHNFIVMLVSNKSCSSLYLYDDKTHKKGSDEVVSCIFHYIESRLPKTVKGLDIWCDGCTHQCWNNYTAMFFEMLLDNNSPLHEEAPNLVCITLWRNPRGHTYMETHMQGEKLAHKGREILNNTKTQGAMHIVMPHPKDPHFTISWSKLVEDAGLDVILINLKMFKSWGDFFIDSRPSPYKKPDQ